MSNKFSRPALIQQPAHTCQYNPPGPPPVPPPPPGTGANAHVNWQAYEPGKNPIDIDETHALPLLEGTENWYGYSVDPPPLSALSEITLMAPWGEEQNSIIVIGFDDIGNYYLIQLYFEPSRAPPFSQTITADDEFGEMYNHIKIDIFP